VQEGPNCDESWLGGLEEELGEIGEDAFAAYIPRDNFHRYVELFDEFWAVSFELAGDPLVTDCCVGLA
jgi:hypothetical protein